MRSRQDDAEDEDGNVLEYCGQLSRYSLTPATNTKHTTTIEPCDVNSSPNTLQAILGEHRNQNLPSGGRDAHHDPEQTKPSYTWRIYFCASHV